MNDHLATLDATAQAALVRSGEMKPAELVEAAIARIAGPVGTEVNAVPVVTAADAVRDATAVSSDLPFPGVPFAVKDCVPVAGAPRYQAMRLLRDLDVRSPFDAHVVGRLRRAGAVPIGRASMPELQGGISTEPAVYGPTRNPWDPSLSTGGSSGGSAAAVAAGLVPAALGVDGGGSIRIPSAVCGVVGLKPSRGRVSLGPELADTTGWNENFVITRSIRDCAAFLDLLSWVAPGEPWTAPAATRPYRFELTAEPVGLRIGVWTPGPNSAPADAECVAAVTSTAALLEELGHHVETSHPTALDHAFPEPFFVLAAAHIAWVVARIEREIGRSIGPEDVEPVTWAAIEGGRQVDAITWQNAYDAMTAYGQGFAGWWADRYDLLVTPTLAVRPYPLGALTPPNPDETWPDVRPWIPFTAQFNISGLPAISLPLHWSDAGVPIGVQLGAAYGREDLLLRVAAQLEAARPWAQRRPRLHA